MAHGSTYRGGRLAVGKRGVHRAEKPEVVAVLADVAITPAAGIAKPLTGFCAQFWGKCCDHLRFAVVPVQGRLVAGAAVCPDVAWVHLLYPIGHGVRGGPSRRAGPQATRPPWAVPSASRCSFVRSNKLIATSSGIHSETPRNRLIIGSGCLNMRRR